jgi:hypothetical protein
MAGTEKRAIEIIARVVDVASRPLAVVSSAIRKTAVDGARQFAGLVKSVVSLRTAVSALVGGFAAIRGAQAFASIGEGTEQLSKLANGTGASTARLLVLQNALELSNIEADRFRTLIASLTKAVGQALTDGTAKSAKALGRLGLSLEDLRTSDPVQLFDRLAGSLEQFETAQEKAAAILEVFPKATGDIELLVDVLGRGQAEFRNLIATAEFFGGTIDDLDVAKILRFNDALDVTKLAVDRVGRSASVSISEKLSPIFEKLATFVAQNAERIGAAIGQIVALVAQLVLQITAALLRLLAFVQGNGEKFVEWLEEIPLVGGKAAAALREVFDVRTIEPGARKLRDELAKLADAENKLLDQQAKLRDERARLEKTPGEASAERLRGLNVELQKAIKDRAAVYEQLLEVEARFNEAQAAGGGKPQFDEARNQQEAAKLRAFAGEIGQLSSFDSLPSPPTDLAPIIKALFGADGIPGAKEKTRSFTQGFADGIDRVVQKWTDFGAAGEAAATQILDQGLDGITDAFADIVTGQKSAKEAFRDLARAMLGDLARIIARLLIVKGLQTANLGGSGAALFETGGVMPGTVQKTVPLRAFANGGVVKRPTLALFGEGKASKGEAFVPLPDGRRIPVALSGGGGSTMNVTIQAMDGADVQRVLVRNRGTLRALWQSDVTRIRSVRQNVAGAAR